MTANNHYKITALVLRRTILLSLLLIVVTAWLLSNSYQSLMPMPTVNAQTEDENNINEMEASVAMVQLLIQLEDNAEPSESPDPETADMPDANPELAQQELEPTETTQAEVESTELINNLAEGKSPVIRGHFEIPVLDYLAAVERQAGGRLLIWDKISRKAIGEVRNGRFNPTATLKRFSNRARDLTEDLPIEFRNKVLEDINKLKHFGIWRFVLVIPEQAEQQFQKAITSALASVDLSWNDTDLLQLSYQLKKNKVLAHVEFAKIAGQTINVNQTVKLW